MVLATKFWAPTGKNPWQGGSSRRNIQDSVEDSLRRLQTDYIDLYQVHFPDYETPIDETLGALDDLVRQGKILDQGRRRLLHEDNQGNPSCRRKESRCDQGYSVI